jgi:Holliday junction resolvase
MNNRTLGNSFEEELCEILYRNGFWAHNLKQGKSGQPADVIAVRNKHAYLIDAKVCSDNTFDLTRIEFNQEMAMELWETSGNGVGWFALKTDIFDREVYMISYYVMKAYKNQQPSLSAKEICELGIPIEKWVKKCK